jgi:hypothetical protein
MIVEYGQAQILDHKCYRIEGCDHFSVCKPIDQNHPSYNMLLQFLEGCRKVIIVVQLTIIRDQYYMELNLLN